MGLGVGFSFIQASIMLFVACLLIGIEMAAVMGRLPEQPRPFSSRCDILTAVRPSC